MRSITPAFEPLFLCPECGSTLPMSPPCSCGFILKEIDGILQLMREKETAKVAPFLEAYDRVRSAERWGEDDLDLPFHPKRHLEIWKVRQRTFSAFRANAAKMPRGVALDIGAGNCWMTRHLDQWGFDAIAVDINTSDKDGLRAGQKFIDEGAVFLRIRSGMERLPFASDRIRLIATNASFHYAGDFRAALREFGRVLTPGGIIAIIDTPFYEQASDGERMMAERVADFRAKYGLSESLARSSGYLTYATLRELAETLSLNVRIQRVWPGAARKYEELRGMLIRRQVATFPLILLEKS